MYPDELLRGFSQTDHHCAVIVVSVWGTLARERSPLQCIFGILQCWPCRCDHVVRKWQHPLRMGRGGCYVHRHATQKLLTYSSVDNLSLIHRTYPDTHTDCIFCVVSQRKCFSVARGREQGPDWFRTFPGALEGNEDTQQFMQGVLGCCCIAQASVEENDYYYFLSFCQGDIKRKTWPHTFLCASVSGDRAITECYEFWAIGLMWCSCCHAAHAPATQEHHFPPRTILLFYFCLQQFVFLQAGGGPC